MIERIAEVAPSIIGNFRNLFPPIVEEALKQDNAEMFGRQL
jgi:hypothetical protein